MNLRFYDQVVKHLNVERLDAYRQDDVDHTTALARYLLNIAICDSLYAPLQMVEVTLRNALHESLSIKANTDTWYDSLPLPQWQAKQIRDSKLKLTNQGKTLSPGRVVAEQTFGFWIGFFTRPHMTSGLAYHLAKTAFPLAPKAERNMTKLSPKWQKVRDLRNRVFHHERILHWQDLEDQHRSMTQLIGWMNPELEQLTQMLDRFTEVRSEGLTPWRKQLISNWPAHREGGEYE